MIINQKEIIVIAFRIEDLYSKELLDNHKQSLNLMLDRT